MAGLFPNLFNAMRKRSRLVNARVPFIIGYIPYQDLRRAEIVGEAVSLFQEDHREKVLFYYREREILTSIVSLIDIIRNFDSHDDNAAADVAVHCPRT